MLSTLRSTGTLTWSAGVGTLLRAGDLVEMEEPVEGDMLFQQALSSL